MNTNTITISPATAGYLNALRSLEQSREHYIEAQRETFGETLTEQQLQELATAWDALRDRLQGEISDAVLNWANGEEASI